MQKERRNIWLLWMGVAVCLGVLYYFFLPAAGLSGSSNKTRVFLIGIDAGSWDILQDLMADGKLPHFKQLVQDGSAGHLESFPWKQVIQGTKGIFSPIVWASISTGKMPDKHGIEDFTLPVPSDLAANIQAQGTQGYAVVQLPEMAPARTTLRLRAKSSDASKTRKISVYFNQALQKEIELKKDWEDFDIVIPASLIQEKNQLNFFYEVKPDEVGKPVAAVNYLRFYDQFGEELIDVNFLRDRTPFREGWDIQLPEKHTLASSFHLRSRPIWDIVSENNKRVAVVGWWQSWPAQKVNGYVISSHLGFQGARIKGLGHTWFEKIKDLTYPPDYLKEVEPKLFLPKSIDQEIQKNFYDIDRCSCVGRRQDEIFRNFYWQDRLFETLSLDLLKNRGPFDFFAVYFRGVDASCHQFLGFSEEPDLIRNCTGCDASRLPGIIDKYYIYMDEVLGRLLQYADKHTVVMLVTDHGQTVSGTKGVHKNNGFVVIHGGPIRNHLMLKADVVDVAPTVLYLLGLPVGQDMDGSVMLEAFDPRYLEYHPVAYRATYESLKASKEKHEIVDEEANREGLEQLKALGYIQD